MRDIKSVGMGLFAGDLRAERLWPVEESGQRSRTQEAGRFLAGVGAVGVSCGAAFQIAAMSIPMAVAAFGVLLGRARIHRAVGFTPAVALLAWGVVSLLTVRGAEGFDNLGFLYGHLFLPVLLVALQATDWALKWSLFALVGGVLLHTTLGVLQFAVYGYSDDAFLNLSGDGVLFYLAPGFRDGRFAPSLYAALVVFALAASYRLSTGLPSWLKITGILAGLASLMMNCSRGVFLALIPSLAAWRIDRLARLVIFSVIALLVALMAISILQAKRPEEVRATLSGQDARFQVWHFGLHEVVQRPLLGYGGPGGFEQDMDDRWLAHTGDEQTDVKIKRNLHNTPLNYAAFIGIPGAVLHLLVLGVIGAACWRSSRRGGVAFSGWCFVFMCGMFDATFTSASGSYTSSLLLGLMLVADQYVMAGRSGIIGHEGSEPGFGS